jgi:hypothetical protein
MNANHEDGEMTKAKVLCRLIAVIALGALAAGCAAPVDAAEEEAEGSVSNALVQGDPECDKGVDMTAYGNDYADKKLTEVWATFTNTTKKRCTVTATAYLKTEQDAVLLKSSRKFTLDAGGKVTQFWAVDVVYGKVPNPIFHVHYSMYVGLYRQPFGNSHLTTIP